MKALGKGSVASIVRVGLMIAWWALWLAAAALVLTAIAYGVVLVLVANGSLDATILHGGEGAIRIGDNTNGNFNVTYDEPGGAAWQVVVPALLTGGVAVAGSLVIVWRLRKLFESFTTGDPFRRENALHLRVIWITMVVIELSRYALMALTTLLVFRFRDPNVSSISLELNGERLSTWGSILILIVLAEVFREGARLKEEQELTI